MLLHREFKLKISDGDREDEDTIWLFMVELFMFPFLRWITWWLNASCILLDTGCCGCCVVIDIDDSCKISPILS